MITELLKLLSTKVIDGEFVTRRSTVYPNDMSGKDKFDFLMSTLKYKNALDPEALSVILNTVDFSYLQNKGVTIYNRNVLLISLMLKEWEQEALTAEFHSYLKVIIEETGYDGPFVNKLADLKSQIPAKSLRSPMDAQMTLLEVCYSEYLISRS